MAGIKATLKPGGGFVVINNVPLGTATPPQQPLTVTAPGYITNTQLVALNVTTATYAYATMVKADTTKTGTVSGTLASAETGQPIGNALITFEQSTAGTATTVQAYTANDGTYIVSGIPTGSVAATFQAAGFLSYSATITVAADQGGLGNPPLNAAMIAGSTQVTVAGKVVDVRTAAPLPGASVVIGSAAAVTTQSDGTFTVPGVYVGTQTIAVTLSGYDTYNNTISILPGMAQVLVALNTTESGPPTGPYNLSGNVSISGQSDRSGVTVTANDLVRLVVGGSTTTNVNGDYYLLLTPSTYRIDVTYGGTTLSRTIALGAGRTLSGINFAF
jgi:hypothetical protein